jgi:lipid A 3-O-deacylase PagL
VSAAGTAGAQPTDPDDPFRAHVWNAEFGLHSALEAWNYNGSHEELYGLNEGVTYGLRDGLMLTAQQRVYYVSQRLNDTWVLGLTTGVRVRVRRTRRMSVYVDFALGISDAAIATPPRGTRFNFLAFGSGGTAWRLQSRLHLLAGFQLVHLSNASIKGPGRNPDIEALGPTLGLLVRF